MPTTVRIRTLKGWQIVDGRKYVGVEDPRRNRLNLSGAATLREKARAWVAFEEARNRDAVAAILAPKPVRMVPVFVYGMDHPSVS